MKYVTLVEFDHMEAGVFAVAANHIRPDDHTDWKGSVLRGFGRANATWSQEQVQQALAEVRHCKARLLGIDLTGLPAGLVHPGTDLRAISDDIYEVARRELDPAEALLLAAVPS